MHFNYGFYSSDFQNLLGTSTPLVPQSVNFEGTSPNVSCMYIYTNSQFLSVSCQCFQLHFSFQLSVLRFCSFGFRNYVDNDFIVVIIATILSTY